MRTTPTVTASRICWDSVSSSSAGCRHPPGGYCVTDTVDREFYLRKESVGAVDSARMGLPFWEKDKSYRFLVSMQRYLQSPVADLGCGHGPLTILTARLGFEVTGFDCIRKNIENGNRLKAPDDKVTFVESFLDRIPAADNSFSSGVLKEVLEHIVVPEIPAVLGEARRILAPGARLIVTVPRESLLSRNPSVQHVTFFESPRVLAEVLRRNGFEIVRKEYNRLYRRICVVGRVPQRT
ncbi:MAG: methyltransferase domain-containing protein [Chitinivibrionales bacterium]|nr:methyltransferase domain-containing protein [Chitinivibrionales bacterium]